MGTVGFQWSGDGFLLLMNQDKFDDWKAENVGIQFAQAQGVTLKGAHEGWADEWFAYKRGREEWFGYNRGRLAFVVDEHDILHSTDLIHRFLRCEMTPRQFAEDELNKEAQNFGPRSQIILGDIKSSKSMVYLSKRTRNNITFDIDDVDHGVHTISTTGFDDTNSPKDEGLRGNITAMINEGEELPPIQDIVKKLMSTSPVFIHRIDSLVKYRTIHTIGLEVKVNREDVHFYEQYLKDDDTWQELGRQFNKYT